MIEYSKYIFKTAAIFLFLSGGKMEAQERKMLHGRVVADSLENIEKIHVINLTSQKGTTTDGQGKFIIPSQAGDSIYFSALQFENKTLVVKETDFNKKEVLIILMEKFNELAEVQIDNIKLSGVLSQDAGRMPKSVYEEYGFSFPKKPRSGLEIAMNSASADPLSLLLNILNGNIKELKKAEEMNARQLLATKGFHLLGEDAFVQIFEIPKEEIINFMWYCAEFNDFEELVAKKDKLKFIEYLQAKIGAFKKRRELD